MKYFLMACLLLTAIVSCTSKKDEERDKGLEPLAYTMYTERSELFVEFRPLVVGKTSKFAAHLTKLGENFLPYLQGKVTVSLVVNGKGIRNSADTPSSPGIFRLALQPVQAGVGRLVFDIATREFTDQVTIDSIPVYATEAAALAAQPEEAANANEISYLKEQAWKIEFANAPVNYEPFNDVIHTTGQISSAPGDEAVIAAQADGVVRFTGNSKVQGAAVQAGQALFVVSGGGVTGNNIDAAVQTARSEYNKARADYNRARDLVKDQLISRKEFSDIELRYQNSQTALNNLSRNYGGGGKTHTTPISGFIRSIAVTEGQFVSAGQPLATVSRNTRLMLRADVPQKDFGKISNLQSANFITPDKRVISTKALNGRLVSSARNTGENSLMLPVFFEIDNTADLIPGSVVEVYLNSGVIVNALVVPLSALIEEQGKFYVYVQTEGESFEKREVSLGATDGFKTQLLSGVEPGERVVIKGAYQIKLATMSGTMPAHGHEH
jgi:membrane fusion protein, heavy metal efflux system